MHACGAEPAHARLEPSIARGVLHAAHDVAWCLVLGSREGVGLGLWGVVQGVEQRAGCLGGFHLLMHREGRADHALGNRCSAFAAAQPHVTAVQDLVAAKYRGRHKRRRGGAAAA